MTIESDIQTRILLTASESGLRLFRNNIGVGWIGSTKRIADGSMLIGNPRPLHAGLHLGSGDLIGWTPIVIRDHMVGKTVAVFTSVEVKKPGGRTSKAQRHWCDAVSAQGGIAGICRCDDDLNLLVSKFLCRDD